jgi:hypothetical protein
VTYIFTKRAFLPLRTHNQILEIDRDLEIHRLFGRLQSDNIAKLIMRHEHLILVKSEKIAQPAKRMARREGFSGQVFHELLSVYQYLSANF